MEKNYEREAKGAYAKFVIGETLTEDEKSSITNYDVASNLGIDSLKMRFETIRELEEKGNLTQEQLEQIVDKTEVLERATNSVSELTHLFDREHHELETQSNVIIVPEVEHNAEVEYGIEI